VIRGRLVDATGAPLKARRMVAQMRDAPTEWTFGLVHGDGADTDDQGRFWFVRLAAGVYDLEVVGEPLLRGARGLVPGSDDRLVEVVPGGTIAGRVVDEEGERLTHASVVALKPGAGWDVVQAATVSPDGTFRLGPLDPARTHRVVATTSSTGGGNAHARADDVRTGSADLTLSIDTRPRLRVRVLRANRAVASVRLTRIAGGPPVTFEFRDTKVDRDGATALDWRLAMEGTWRVSALADDVTSSGTPTRTWVDVGTVSPGEAVRTFDLPR
jgi:hypothetical protein